jgi:hypothetical protein
MLSGSKHQTEVEKWRIKSASDTAVPSAAVNLLSPKRATALLPAVANRWN